MNILSLFVLIPLFMMLGLWMARSVNQVRGVMVAGSSALLVLAVWLAVDYLRLRALIANLPFPQPEMLYTDSVVVRSLAYLLFRRGGRHFRGHVAAECHHRVHGHFRFMETETPHERIFPVVHLAFHGRVRFLHLHRPFHHVHVL